MQMLELTLAEPGEFKGEKVLINPKNIAGIVDTREFGYIEVSFNGASMTYRVQETYKELKQALASI